ncbi:hypothetical protein CY34DRAFT_799253 [Suillus luteus UH-Slu-Lm8-n1]|uniref:Uncharacterized protein n=1 Tax=Suillus luteus UH-Slu-Lm8-n1 TaxID=930992 RepID=A0A0D0AB91_9AGAM|nr:hypothetical protein CY34DRAFT_799253 [Suillus luteus UH-Slu-Lm8-n1]
MKGYKETRAWPSLLFTVLILAAILDPMTSGTYFFLNYACFTSCLLGICPSPDLPCTCNSKF